MSDIHLWLDDERPMPTGFTHHARTAPEAIEILKTGLVVEASLDHDLGIGCGTGYDVACWLEANAASIPKIRCRIHSMNVVGKQRMKMALRRALLTWMGKV